jgi:hypothetical protein
VDSPAGKEDRQGPRSLERAYQEGDVRECGQSVGLARQQGLTGYAAHLLVMERFGYPDFVTASVDTLIDVQYANRPHLRPICEAIVRATRAISVSLSSRRARAMSHWLRHAERLPACKPRPGIAWTFDCASMDETGRTPDWTGGQRQRVLTTSSRNSGPAYGLHSWLCGLHLHACERSTDRARDRVRLDRPAAPRPRR